MLGKDKKCISELSTTLKYKACMSHADSPSEAVNLMKRWCLTNEQMDKSTHRQEGSNSDSDFASLNKVFWKLGFTVQNWHYFAAMCVGIFFTEHNGIKALYFQSF